MNARPESVEEVIARHRGLTEPEVINHFGHSFITSPGVFSPFIAPSGFLEFSFTAWPIFKEASVLDIGSGSGIPACLFALSGARRVVSVDINPAAVELGATNARALGLERVISFMEGDVFQHIPDIDSFDIFFADLPFMSRRPHDILERAFFDPELSALTDYISGVSRRLHASHGGRAFFCFSDLDSSDVTSTAANVGLGCNEVLVVRLPWVRLSLIELRTF
jgi:predicted RNA methylase